MTRRAALLLILFALPSLLALGQQPPPVMPILQTGALNVPTSVLTENGQWLPLLPVLTSPSLDLYIEDVSNNEWLDRNAANFLNRGQFTVTVVSFYKTRQPCREDQVHAGLSDAAHLNACDNYRYAVRQVAVDAPQNSITLNYTLMVYSGGVPDLSSARRETVTRAITQFGPDFQKALSDATALVAKQSRMWAARQQNAR